jgi:hypothetical protein
VKRGVEANFNVKEEWKSMKDHAVALECDEEKHLEVE